MAFPVLAILSNPLIRNLLVYATIALACWMGWNYVQDLRQDNKDLQEVVEEQAGKINNLGLVQAAQKETLEAQAEAQRKYEQLLGSLGKEFASYKLRNAVSIPDLVLTDPAKAQRQIADEYQYRLKCIEFITGKTFTVEELKKIAPYCGAVK